MNTLLENLISGKVFGKIKELIDEVVTTKEEKERLHLRLRELEFRHEEAMSAAGIADTASARQRETDALKAGSINHTQNVLAYLAIIAFFTITGYILSHGVGKLDTDESFIIGNLTGMAAAIAKDIYGYYFGSSRGEYESKKRPVKQI